MDITLSENMLSTVDNKMNYLERILTSDNFYESFDISNLYLFIHMLVHEKFIFYNFFEKLFVEIYVESHKNFSQSPKEILKRITTIIAKICNLKSYCT